MKKNFLFAIIGIVLFTACNKEELITNSENSNQVNSTVFRYNESFKVFDKTGEYFVEYTIKSNNLEEFNINKSMLENSYIEPGYSIPSSTYKNSIKTDTKAQMIDYSQALVVSIDSLAIGTNNNFRLISKDESRGLVVQGFTWWGYFIFEPNFDTYSITVACNWGYAVATDYSIDYASQGNPIGSHIMQQQTELILSGGTYAFPPTGYLRHRIKLIGGPGQSSCTLFIYTW